MQIWSTSKTKLNYRDQLDRVQFVTNTRQDKDMIGCIGLVYVANLTELSRPI